MIKRACLYEQFTPDARGQNFILSLYRDKIRYTNPVRFLMSCDRHVPLFWLALWGLFMQTGHIKTFNGDNAEDSSHAGIYIRRYSSQSNHPHEPA